MISNLKSDYAMSRGETEDAGESAVKQDEYENRNSV